MNRFDRANLEIIREDLMAALLVVKQKHGVNINFGTFSYNEFQFTGKMTVRVNTPEAAAVITETIPSWVPINTVITFQGCQFMITGYDARKHKYPIKATRVNDGRSFRLPKTSVQRF